MSTILQALQKNQLDQSTRSIQMVSTEDKLQVWKIIVSLSLVIIIFLLSTVIHLQLNPRKTVAQEKNNNDNFTRETPKNNIMKVSFDTQPLDFIPREVQAVERMVVLAPAKEILETQLPPMITSHHTLDSDDKPLMMTDTHTLDDDQQLIIDATQKVANNDLQYVIDDPQELQYNQDIDNQAAQQELNYDQVSSNLKSRFEIALFLEEMEENDGYISQDNDYNNINNVIDDGSDIRQMNRSFQHKVPVMHYDSHMYSSEIDDRWIRINGEILKEGQVDSSGQIELIEIQPQRSIFRLQRQSFSLESLADWQGY